MNSSSILIVTASILAFCAIFAALMALILRSQLLATQTELKVAHDDLSRAKAELERLTTSQARKIDRALWFLAKVRARKLQPGDFYWPTVHTRITVELDESLARALTPISGVLRGSEDTVQRTSGDRLALRDLFAESLARTFTADPNSRWYVHHADKASSEVKEGEGAPIPACDISGGNTGGQKKSCQD